MSVEVYDKLLDFVGNSIAVVHILLSECHNGDSLSIRASICYHGAD